MKRPLHILSVLSFLLALLTLGLWIRSYFHGGEGPQWRYSRQRRVDETFVRYDNRYFFIDWGNGGIGFIGSYDSHSSIPGGERATTFGFGWDGSRHLSYPYTPFQYSGFKALGFQAAYSSAEFPSYVQRGGDPPRGTRISLTLPLGYLFLLFTLLPTRWFLIRRKKCRLLALRENRCAHCGYDLRATPDRCPECGTPVLHPAPGAASPPGRLPNRR